MQITFFKAGKYMADMVAGCGSRARRFFNCFLVHDF